MYYVYMLSHWNNRVLYTGMTNHLAWSVAKPLGIDANAFGMIVIFNCMIGLITPPVGGNVFLIAGLTNVPLQKVFRQALPFVVGFLMVLVLMSIFPEIVSFFPNLIMG